MRLTKSDVEAWWNLPVGIEFRKMLYEDMEKLGHGNMTGALARDHIGNAIEVGRYQRTMELYNLDYKAVVGGEDE